MSASPASREAGGGPGKAPRQRFTAQSTPRGPYARLNAAGAGPSRGGAPQREGAGGLRGVLGGLVEKTLGRARGWVSSGKSTFHRILSKLLAGGPAAIGAAALPGAGSEHRA